MQFKAIKFMESAEGRNPKAYYDSAGKLTIGIGHLLTVKEILTGIILIDGKRVSWQEGLSDDQIDELLRQDIWVAHQALHASVHVDLSHNQHDALVSFIFNIGVGGWRGSTALKVLNAGEYTSVPDAMRMWNKVTKNGRRVVSQGLVNRREAEIKLWNMPDGER